MKLIAFLHATEAKKTSSKKEKLQATVGGNEGELNSDDNEPRPPPNNKGEEGNAGWEWTDPYHSSGTTNAVLSGTP